MLVHALSELVETGDVKPGQIILNTTDEAYAPAGKPFPVIPLYYWKGRTLFPPRDTGSTTVICRSIDAKIGQGLPGGTCATCDKGQWTKDPLNDRNIPPNCIEQHNFAFLVPGKPEGENIAVCSMGKTSLKAGRILLGRLQHLKNVPFGYVFNLSSKIEESNGNRYWIFDFVNHDENNRLEMPLNKFDEKRWSELFEASKIAADKIREEHQKAKATISSEPVVDGSLGTSEVPF